jgi:tryptophan synthase alpha chain
MNSNKQKIKLMTHVVAGYPSLQATEKLVLDMAKAGVDFIEIQIPFSDPLADGPTIMEANDLALKNGTTVQDCFTLMKKLSAQVNIPLLFMSYYNILFNYGVENFCKKAHACGAQGLIIPDIPIDEEEHDHFIANCERYHLNHIRLLSPSSTEDRIKLNAQVQNGFVYCTSRVGTTGTKNKLSPDLKNYLKKIRRYISVPIAVGFGISRPEHVQALIGHADIAVIGSSIIEKIKKDGINSIQDFIKKLCF